MAHYCEGYDFYLKKCEQFELEPINFYYYGNQLSQDKLEYYNTNAHEGKLLIWSIIEKVMRLFYKMCEKHGLASRLIFIILF